MHLKMWYLNTNDYYTRFNREEREHNTLRFRRVCLLIAYILPVLLGIQVWWITWIRGFKWSKDRALLCSFVGHSMFIVSNLGKLLELYLFWLRFENFNFSFDYNTIYHTNCIMVLSLLIEMQVLLFVGEQNFTIPLHCDILPYIWKL